MKRLLALFLLFAAPVLAQQGGGAQVGGSGGGLTVVTTLPATCTPGGANGQVQIGNTIWLCTATNTFTQQPPVSGSVIANGLIGDYQALAGETVATLPDHSGKGNNATATVGTAPTITAVTGGLSCPGSGAVLLPAAVNGALTIQLFIGFQPQTPSQTAQLNAPIMGNGNGAASNAAGIILYSSIGTDVWGPPGQGMARIRTFSPGNNYKSSSLDTFVGNRTLTWTLDTLDHIFIDTTETTYVQTGASATLNTFPFQLCGAAAGSGDATQTYFNGTIYRALLYNRVLTAAEIAQNVQAMQQSMIARGVTLLNSPTDATDTAVIRGDSISVGLGWPAGLSLAPTTGNWDVVDQGFNGDNMLQSSTTMPTTANNIVRPNSARNVTVYWEGTNDTLVSHFPYMKAGVQQIKPSGSKVIVATMISRTGLDFYKNQLNALTRSLWPLFADGLCDFAADTRLGADNAFSNGTYFNADGVHLIAAGNTVVSTIATQCINRMFGNTQASGNFTTVKIGATMKPQFRVPANAGVSASQGAGTTLTLAMPFTPLAKSLLVGGVTWTGAVTITSVTDTSGDTCAAIGAASNYFATTRFQMWYCQNVTNAAQTITINLSGAGSGAGGEVDGMEVTGILNTAGPVDLSSAYATGNSANPLTAGILTTVAGDFLLGGGADFAAAYVPSGNYVPVFGTQNAITNRYIGNNTDSTVTGTYTAGWNTPFTSNLWTAGVTAFKPAVYFSPYNMTQMDVYTQVDPSGGAVVLNMVTSVGITGQTVTIQNIGTNGSNQVSLTPLGAETINGVTGASAYIIPNQTTTVCTSVLVSPTAAGSNWQCVNINAKTPRTIILTSSYANPTNGFTNMTDGTNNMAFALAPNTNYQLNCSGAYQAAATGGLNIEFTGPAGFTALNYSLTENIAAGAPTVSATANAYSVSQGNTITTASTNFPFTIALQVENGATAGTLQLLGKASATVALGLTVAAGTSCTLSQQ